jgi:protein-S-isoprenylcysteine O-methyltransferase Ste14
MSLLLRNLFFTLLQPGMVAGVIPFLILRKNAQWQFISFPAWTYLGMVLFIPGFLILLICITDFARKGKGTLSPADPTKQLVISGLYRYSRNPMYVGVMLMLVGEAIFFQSFILAGYALLIFLLFYGFVVWFEEPRLLRDFGMEYKQYQESTRRWI